VKCSAGCVTVGALALLGSAVPAQEAERTTVHFAAGAAGKPMSLTFDVAPGERVAAAAAAGGPRTPLAVPSDGVVADAWVECTLPAAGPTADVGGLEGIEFRASEHGRYLVTLARPAGELRVERTMAGDVRTLAVARVTAPLDRPVRLAVQFVGFRLQVFVDDAPVVRVFDGGFVRGRFGAVRPGKVAGQRLDVPATVYPVADDLPAAALVQAPGRARAVMHTAAPFVPGCHVVVECVLDRPHPLVPRDHRGLEPALLVRPATPVVWMPFVRGELAPDGRAAVPFAVRAPSGLAHHPFFVRAVFVTADGSTRLASSNFLQY
jgi:hypothetical protein